MAEQAGLGQGAQGVVDGLVGHLPDPLPDQLDHRAGVGVGVLLDDFEDGDPLTGDPEVVVAKDRFGVEIFRDVPEDNGFLESIKSP